MCTNLRLTPSLSLSSKLSMLVMTLRSYQMLDRLYLDIRGLRRYTMHSGHCLQCDSYSSSTSLSKPALQSAFMVRGMSCPRLSCIFLTKLRLSARLSLMVRLVSCLPITSTNDSQILAQLVSDSPCTNVPSLSSTSMSSTARTNSGVCPFSLFPFCDSSRNTSELRWPGTRWCGLDTKLDLPLTTNSLWRTSIISPSFHIEGSPSSMCAHPSIHSMHMVPLPHSAMNGISYLPKLREVQPFQYLKFFEDGYHLDFCPVTFSAR